MALVLSLIGAQAPGSAGPLAVGSVPPEPGVIVLPARPTLHAIAGDVDGDGARELVRLVVDGAGATLVEAWRQEGDEWASAGEAVALRAPIRRSPDADDVYGDGASRLIVWDDGARERILVATQPRFELLDVEVGERCCLLIDELVLDPQRPERVALRPLAARSPSVDGLLAIDLDGDGLDELLATRSHSRSGGAVPLTVLFYRWQGSAFGAPETRDLLYGGDGSAPFVLGDTDGAPGDEAGLLADGTGFQLYRIRLAPDGRLEVEPSGIGGVATAAAVRLADGSGAAIHSARGLHVYRWSAAEDPVEVVGRPAVPSERLVGVLEAYGGASVLVVTQPLAGEPPLMLTADTLEARRPSVPPRQISPAISAAARPYAGPIPGGDGQGLPAVIGNGMLYPAGIPVASLINAAPVGFVGDGSWLALIHADIAPDVTSPSGGILEDGAPLPGASLAVVPGEVAMATEEDGGRLTASMDGTVADPTGRSPVRFVDAAGFRTSVEAPPGSRIVIGGASPGRFQGPLVVPESGVLPVRIRPSEEVRESGLIKPTLVALTPAGHAYVARWELRVLDAPPPLDASAHTSLGAMEVTVRGSTVPFAEVRVDGTIAATDADGRFVASVPAPPWPTTLTIEAIDPLGNRNRVTLEAVGLLDYRRLPWPEIVAVLTLAVAVGLWLRVPRIRQVARRDGDARLEDLEP